MTPLGSTSRPSALGFLRIRDFVVAYDEWARSKRTGYSRRTFAKWAKVSSPNFLTLVISGKRKMSSEWLQGFCLAAKLSPEESEFLKTLLQFEKEEDNEARGRLLDKLHGIATKSSSVTLAGDQLSLLKNPLAWTLLQMIQLRDQKDEAKWFKNRLIQKVSVTDIRESLGLLGRLGLAAVGVNKKWKALGTRIESPDQIQAAENARFHSSVLREGMDVLETYAPSERSFGSLTLSISKDKEEELKSEIARFGRMLAKKYQNTEADEIFRLNIQLYPLTKTEVQK